MLDWGIILDKLERVKRLVTEDAPAALTRLADGVDEFEQAVRRAAEWLDHLDDSGTGGKTMSAQESMDLDRLEQFALSCEQEMQIPNERRASDEPGKRNWEVLLPIIVEFVRWIIERRRPKLNAQ
jgi:hypothetical protein